MKKKFIIPIIIVIAGVAYWWLTCEEDAPIVVSPTQSAVEGSITYASEAINFAEISNSWDHVYADGSFSFIGGTVLDVDNDGVDEFFVTGGKGQRDAYFVYENGSVVNKIDSLGIANTEASYGATSIDLDNDGDADLVVARQSGLYAYYNNGGLFEELQLDVPFAADTVPVDIAAGDIDRDGDADLYISTFITASKLVSATFNKDEHGKPNMMLRNEDGRQFTDVTTELGLDYPTNTFAAAFVELNGDNNIDLVLSPNTNRIQIYKNTGSGFEALAPIGDYGFWMGLGMTDIDQDGDIDLFLSNSGSSIPARLARGDLRDDQALTVEYALLRNDGDFNFTDVHEDAGSLPFGWGIVAHDFNNDNQDEWLVSQNYVSWPPHKLKKNPGSLLQRGADGYVDVVNGSGLENKNYGLSSLVGDINGDGVADVAHLNIGGPVRVLLAEGTTENNTVQVLLPDTAAAQQSSYTLTVGETTVSKSYVPKQGLMTDQAAKLYFSLGDKESGVLSVTDVDGAVTEHPITSAVLDLR